MTHKLRKKLRNTFYRTIIFKRHSFLIVILNYIDKCLFKVLVKLRGVMTQIWMVLAPSWGGITELVCVAPSRTSSVYSPMVYIVLLFLLFLQNYHNQVTYFAECLILISIDKCLSK